MPPSTEGPSSPAPTSPVTRILKHPPKLVRTSGRSARLVFRLGADQSNATFLCRIDRARFRSCPGRFVRRYGLGRHVLKVKARNSSGLVDTTPAVFRFRVLSAG